MEHMKFIKAQNTQVLLTYDEAYFTVLHSSVYIFLRECYTLKESIANNRQQA